MYLAGPAHIFYLRLEVQSHRQLLCLEFYVCHQELQGVKMQQPSLNRNRF